MQETTTTTTMPPPQTPTGKTKSNKTSHSQEADPPFSPQNPPSESKSAPKPHEKEEKGVCASSTVATKSDGTVEESSCSTGRERLKRHRVEVAGRVWIPDMWGQEDLLKDWIDCAAFDASLVNSRIVLARDSLMGEGRRATAKTIKNTFIY